MPLFYTTFIIVFLILLTVALAAVSLAPWVPMKKRDLRRIFRLADLKPDEIFYDLGCGDGRVVRYIAKNSTARAVGLEMALPLFWYCKLRQVFLKKKAEILWKNLFKENLSKADVVYFFGLPDSIEKKLKQKLKQELKPGARVISYTFKIHGWQPARVDRPEKKAAIYLYII